ncbi:MAG: hypothetical protein R3B06_26875 [Kofleriaceae bacterium]
MKRAGWLVVAAVALGGCSAGVRTRYRATPPPPCGGLRPYTPAVAAPAMLSQRPCPARQP